MRPFLALAALFSSCAAPSGSTFLLEAEWSAIASSTYGLDSEAEFTDALNPGPALDRARYGWEDVVPMLPPTDAIPGDVWPVDVVSLVAFLKQLHPGATATLHHHSGHMRLEDLPPEVEFVPGPRGPQSVESLRELGVETFETTSPGAPVGCHATLLTSGDVVDVLLRGHAEFEIEPGRVYYTPAQFEARLVARVDTREVLSFSIAVPDRDTNVDLNAKGASEPDGSFARADIGYVRRLGLATEEAAPSIPAPVLEAARSRLALAFYPFEAIEWKPLAEAWDAARRLGRPLHVLLLFGTLDDEAC